MKSEFFAGFDDADGMIRANGDAEAREADRLRSENADFRRQAETSAAQGRAILEAINEATYRDGVRVYRNVQAALISELDKQTKDLEAAIYAMQQTQNNMDAALREMQEEAAEKKAPKKGASALQVLTFLAALLTLLFEVCDKLGLVDRLLAML